ncbi:hypothetical protein EBU91_01965, partial [bacterium]|nr:hypothetical protein [bacterium]
KFMKLLNSVLNEQEEMENKEGDIAPTPMDDKIPSALPEEKDVALDIIKYKNLLKALREALYNSSKDNLEKQREISNVDVDSDDMDELKKSENQLMAFLDREENIPSSEE